MNNIDNTKNNNNDDYNNNKVIIIMIVIIKIIHFCIVKDKQLSLSYSLMDLY